jgi:acyl carrier protein
MPDIEATVIQCTRQILGGADAQVSPETPLRDLELDSLSMLELKMQIEDKLDAELEVEVFKDATTLRDLAGRIEESLSGPTDALARR